MKIIVVYPNGKQEIIDLPHGTRWRVSDDPNTMNLLHGEHGFDHFFNCDGTYDGWGGAVCATPVEADAMIAVQEEKRHCISGDDHKS